MSLQKKLIAQFHHPKGFLGIIAGRIMANRESNLARNRWTVDLLNLQPDDHVLELVQVSRFLTSLSRFREDVQWRLTIRKPC